MVLMGTDGWLGLVEERWAPAVPDRLRLVVFFDDPTAVRMAKTWLRLFVFMVCLRFWKLIGSGSRAMIFWGARIFSKSKVVSPVKAPQSMMQAFLKFLFFNKFRP